MNSVYCSQHGRENPPCPECTSSGRYQFYYNYNAQGINTNVNNIEVKLDKIIELLYKLTGKL